MLGRRSRQPPSGGRVSGERFSVQGQVPQVTATDPNTHQHAKAHTGASAFRTQLHVHVHVHNAVQPKLQKVTPLPVSVPVTSAQKSRMQWPPLGPPLHSWPLARSLSLSLATADATHNNSHVSHTERLLFQVLFPFFRLHPRVAGITRDIRSSCFPAQPPLTPPAAPLHTTTSPPLLVPLEHVCHRASHQSELSERANSCHAARRDAAR